MNRFKTLTETEINTVTKIDYTNCDIQVDESSLLFGTGAISSVTDGRGPTVSLCFSEQCFFRLFFLCFFLCLSACLYNNHDSKR